MDLIALGHAMFTTIHSHSSACPLNKFRISFSIILPFHSGKLNANVKSSRIYMFIFFFYAENRNKLLALAHVTKGTPPVNVG